jgi:hypothetical protein
MAAFDDALCALIEEYQPISVRGVFYRAESAGLVPKTEHGYEKVQRHALRLRRQGRVPYAWITDGTRFTYGDTDRWPTIDDFAEDAALFYRKDIWRGLDEVVEIWCEKDSMAGLVAPVIVGRWRSLLYVGRGFESESYAFKAGGAIAGRGKPTHIDLLSDFDPSGECIAENVARKLPRFTRGVPVHVRKLALTFEQVRGFGLATREVKRSDNRSPGFVGRYGPISAELEALTPTDLRAIVDAAIARHASYEAIRALERVEAEEQGLYGRWLALGREAAS